jgi:hypothetical protein
MGVENPVVLKASAVRIPAVARPNILHCEEFIIDASSPASLCCFPRAFENLEVSVPIIFEAALVHDVCIYLRHECNEEKQREQD